MMPMRKSAVRSRADTSGPAGSFVAALVLAAGLIWMLSTPAWPQSAEHQHGQATTENAPKRGHMMMGHRMMGHGQSRGQGAQAQHHAGTIPHLEGRLAFLRVEIGITEGQVEAWNAFADAVRKANKLWTDAPAAEPKATWREGLERREKAAAVRLEGLRTIRGAADSLFAVLTDNQKSVADQLLNGPMGLRGAMGAAHAGRMAGPRRHL